MVKPFTIQKIHISTKMLLSTRIVNELPCLRRDGSGRHDIDSGYALLMHPGPIPQLDCKCSRYLMEQFFKLNVSRTNITKFCLS